MTLHTESDHIHLVTDPTVYVYTPDGRQQGIVPYRLGVPPVIVRRDAQGRPYTKLPSQVQQIITLQNGVIQQQLKKMQPPTAAPPMRISSGGGMRPPSVPVTSQQQPTQQTSAQTQPSASAPPVTNHSPHPSPVPVPQHSPPNTACRPAISMPHIEVPKADSIMCQRVLLRARSRRISRLNNI